MEELTMERKDMPDILYDIIKQMGGKAKMMDIFKIFWQEYEDELKKSGDLFYTWNYDIRWAATKLRKENRMKQAKEQENTYGQDISSKGIWEIIEKQ